MNTIRLKLADPVHTTIPVPADVVARFDLAMKPAMTADEAVTAALAAMRDDYDSLSREALFVRATERLGIPYSDLYDAWLSGSDQLEVLDLAGDEPVDWAAAQAAYKDRT